MHLQQFRFDVQYRPGKTLQNADGLSRFPADPPDFASATEDLYSIYRVNFIVDEWLTAQAGDPFCISANNSINGSARQDEKSPYVVLENGLIAQADGKILVPRTRVAEILERFHDHKMAGHHGVPKTLHRIKNRFTWPTLNKDVTKYVKSCLKSAKRKAHGGARSPLSPMPVANYLWERVAMDIVGPLPTSKKDNKYILVIGEYVSRYVETAALPDQTADSVAQAFLEKIILRYGCPSNVLTDQGSNFQSELFEKIYSILGIKKLRTAAYTPRTNGFVEKMNRLLVDSLTIFVHNNPTDWCTY